ncbi:MAG: CapA family protein [Coriobacteriaceae bacterium]|nr:CapA family protein [Coriobacteriaceae bacterium]
MNQRNNTPLGLYGGDARGVYGSSGYGHGGMIYAKPRRRWPRILIIILIIAAIVAVCIWLFSCGPLSSGSEGGSTENTQTEQPADAVVNEGAIEEAAPTGETVSFQVSAIGDCTLGDDVNYDSNTAFSTVYNDLALGKPGYFFKQVKKYTDSDALTIANFEGTLSTRGTREDKEFAFRGDPSYAKILKKGSVEAVSLANNHAFDYGDDAYEDTKTALDDEGIVSFGYDRNATYDVQGITVGLLGINVLNGYDDSVDLMKDDIDQLKDEGCDLIIGMFHWGIEGDYAPDSEQVSMAHEAIDEGVDLVLGAHPHVLQGIECYNDRYICYSLGNFCFGGNDNPMDYNTMIFQQTFTFVGGVLVMDDENLEDIDVVPCSVSSSTSTNNYQPTPLTGKRAKSLLKDLNENSANLDDEGVKLQTTVNDAGCAVLTELPGGGSDADEDEDEEEDEDEDDS